jgi:crotonobetainyl-CoA:carnitine CoA-transferase CaiB-like acyl-CoA transferase
MLCIGYGRNPGFLLPALDDPHLNAGGFFQRREHPTEGSYIEVRQPVRFAGMDYPDARHAPTIGQDTEEINRELGLEG